MLSQQDQEMRRNVPDPLFAGGSHFCGSGAGRDYGLTSQTRQSAAIVIMRKEFADGPRPYTDTDIRNCRAASVSERSEANDRCLFEPRRYISDICIARHVTAHVTPSRDGSSSKGASALFGRSSLPGMLPRTRGTEGEQMGMATTRLRPARRGGHAVRAT